MNLYLSIPKKNDLVWSGHGILSCTFANYPMRDTILIADIENCCVIFSGVSAVAGTHPQRGCHCSAASGVGKGFCGKRFAIERTYKSTGSAWDVYQERCFEIHHWECS